MAASALASADPMSRLDELIKCSRQIEQNTRQEQTAVLYKTRKELNPIAEKVDAKIRANVFAITDIDNLRQEFTARLKISIRWKEMLLRGVKPEDEIDWDDQWSPRIELENAISVTNLDRKFTLRYFEKDLLDGIPHVCLNMMVSATFKEMFELDEFPLDYQALNIWLTSEWPFDQVEMIRDEDYMDHISTNTFTESAEWELSRHVIGAPVGTPQPVHDVTGSSDCYSLYSVTAHVSRKLSYYLFQHFFPMFLVHCLSFCAFAIPPTLESTSSRLGVAVLSMILLLALRFTLERGLPNIAYMTFYDKYYLCLVVIQSLIVAELAIVGKVAQYVSAHYVEWADYAVVGATLLLSFCVHMYFCLAGWEISKKRKLFLDESSSQFHDINEVVWKHYTEESKVHPSMSGAPPTGSRDMTNPIAKTYEVKLKAKHKKKSSKKKSRGAVKPTNPNDDDDDHRHRPQGAALVTSSDYTL